LAFGANFISGWIWIRTWNADPDPVDKFNADPDTDPHPKHRFFFIQVFFSLGKLLTM
jgi:hypothetical protein